MLFIFRKQKNSKDIYSPKISLAFLFNWPSDVNTLINELTFWSNIETLICPDGLEGLTLIVAVTLGLPLGTGAFLVALSVVCEGATLPAAEVLGADKGSIDTMEDAPLVIASYIALVVLTAAPILGVESRDIL